MDIVERIVEQLKSMPESSQAEVLDFVKSLRSKQPRVYEKIIEQGKGDDHRPWGFYEILSDTPDHKVKRITVYPGRRLSYQRHFRRSEHWYVISGKAVVTRNGEETELTTGQAVEVPVRTWHRIRNPGPENMAFIEVQTGDYFGEDDIERSEDDYGRA